MNEINWNFKALLRLLTPPIMVDVWNSISRRLRQKSGYIIGYENDVLVRHVVERTTEFKDNVCDLATTSSLIVGISLIPLRKLDMLRVLDFGGASGAHFFQVSHLAPSTSLDWRVVETARMSDMSRERFSEFSSNLKFYDSLSKASENFTLDFDVVIAASSLGYTDNPIENLKMLLSLRPRVIFVNRQVLTEDAQVTLNQRSYLDANGPRTSIRENTLVGRNLVEYALTIPNRLEFEAAILNSGYDFRVRFRDQPAVVRNKSQLFDSWCFLATSK